MKKSLFVATIVVSLAVAISSSVPVLAETEVSEQASMTGAIAANMLIGGLNAEFDRLSSKGYAHEDYDLLSDSGAEIVLAAVFPTDGSVLSDSETREYLIEKAHLVDELEGYATGLENDPERAIFFHNAAWYANELIYAD